VVQEGLMSGLTIRGLHGNTVPGFVHIALTFYASRNHILVGGNRPQNQKIPCLDRGIAILYFRR